MATAIVMPKLGMSMREGTVISWPAAVGASLAKGQVVLVVESEKAQVEVEATQAGVFRHVFVPVGETVPCGTLLGAITASMEEPFDAEAFRREHDRPETVVPPVAAPRTAPRPAAVAAAATRVPVAPAARAVARTLGIDVNDVPGSGPGGRVIKEDVEAFAARRERLVEVAPGVRLEVLREGTGETILLLPGFGTDVSSFALQTRALVQSHALIAVNPRGVGLSDAPDLPAYDVPTAAADAAALLDAAAHVVGASLGAATAIELALRYPDRVRSLTLITPFVDASARLLAVLDAWCRIAAEAGAETLARALLPWMFSERFLQDATDRERTCRGLAVACANVPAPTLERSAAGLRAWSGTRRDQLGELHVPVVVLAAGADLLTPDGATVAAAIPQASLRVIEGAGHALTIEAVEQVTAVIRAHVAGCRRHPVPCPP